MAAHRRESITTAVFTGMDRKKRRRRRMKRKRKRKRMRKRRNQYKIIWLGFLGRDGPGV